jgi:Uma2 family endonuclease
MRVLPAGMRISTAGMRISTAGMRISTAFPREQAPRRRLPAPPGPLPKLWEEQQVPAFVLEVTSGASRIEDKGPKKGLCAELGVREYFMFDPEADYLKPPLQGYRLADGQLLRPGRTKPARGRRRPRRRSCGYGR